jgi:hypothetical protein
MPRVITARSILANQSSTWLSHDELAGAKCRRPARRQYLSSMSPNRGNGKQREFAPCEGTHPPMFSMIHKGRAMISTKPRSFEDFYGHARRARQSR